MPLIGHFTLNFHNFEFWQIIYYILSADSVCTRDQRRYAEADRDLGNIWDPWKLRVFRRRYIVGTLTNKANISI